MGAPVGDPQPDVCGQVFPPVPALDTTDVVYPAVGAGDTDVDSTLALHVSFLRRFGHYRSNTEVVDEQSRTILHLELVVRTGR